MSTSALYGTTTARSATRVLILLQLAIMAIGLWVDFSYEEILLHSDLLEIKETYAASNIRSIYVTGVALVLYLVSLAGLFFMARWARWLFTAGWLLLTLYPLSDWSQVTIAADVLEVPWAILDSLGGATLAVIWLNAWSPPGRGADAAQVTGSKFSSK